MPALQAVSVLRTLDPNSMGRYPFRLNSALSLSDQPRSGPIARTVSFPTLAELSGTAPTTLSSMIASTFSEQASFTILMATSVVSGSSRCKYRFGRINAMMRVLF